MGKVIFTYRLYSRVLPTDLRKAIKKDGVRETIGYGYARHLIRTADIVVFKQLTININLTNIGSPDCQGWLSA